jgi:hypothetical protein
VATVADHTVYLPVDKVDEHFQTQGLDPAQEIAKITGNPDTHAEAEITGQLELPLSDYATKGQDLHAAVGDSAKLDETGIAPADIPAAQEAQQKTVSTKEDSMQAARVARGEAPLLKIPMPTHEAEIATARSRMEANPNLADEVVAKKLGGDTSISAADESILQAHAVDLTNQMEAQAARASDPLASDAERTAARLKGEDLAQRFNELNQATKITGAAWSHFGRQRMQELLKDYSFAALVRKETIRLQRALDPKEVAKIKEQADRIAQLEAEAEVHAQALREAMAGKRKPSGPAKTVDQKAQERLRADIDKLQATIKERLSACPI